MHVWVVGLLNHGAVLSAGMVHTACSNVGGLEDISPREESDIRTDTHTHTLCHFTHSGAYTTKQGTRPNRSRLRDTQNKLITSGRVRGVGELWQ